MKTREKKQLWRVSLCLFIIIVLVYVINFWLKKEIPVADKVFVSTIPSDFIICHLTLSRLWDLPLIFIFIISIVRLWQKNYLPKDDLKDAKIDDKKSSMLILLAFGIIFGIIGGAMGLGLTVILTLAVTITTGFLSQSINHYGLFYGLIIGLITCLFAGAETAVCIIVISMMAFLIGLAIRKIFPKDLGEWLSGES
ncbi:MAG: hypothetical protein WCK59_04920 [Candidatus Falkowbacteria bacterium]